MNRRKKAAAYISAFLILGILGTFVYQAVGKTGEVKVTQIGNEENRINVKAAEANVSDEEYGDIKMEYMIKEYYGNIGIYMLADDEYVLISITDFDVSKLPQADIEALREGIYLENKEKMLLILEDYTS